MAKPEKRVLDDIVARLDRNSDINSILATGVNVDDVTCALKFRAERDNRAAQARLTMPAHANDRDWSARWAWLNDGQPIHGSPDSGLGALEEYYLQARVAGIGGDHDGYHRATDLIFKALDTQFRSKYAIPEPPTTDDTQ